MAGLPLFGKPLAHAQAGVGADTPDATGPPRVTIGPEQDRELEKRAQGLETQLICPICPGETLDQSFVQISQEMKRIIRVKLQEGQDEDQIKDYFVARYPEVGILAAPPRSGFNLVTWIAPPLGVALGIVLLVLVMRQMRRGNADPVAAGVGGPVRDADLSDYLAEVDRDLSLNNPGPPTPDDDAGDDSDNPAERSAEG